MAPMIKASFEAISDSLGVQFDAMLSLLDTDEAADLTAAAVNNLNRVDALADKRAQATLLEPFLNLSEASPIVTAGTMYSAMLQRLQSNTGPFQTYLVTNGIKVSRAFADLCLAAGVNVPASQIFDQTPVILASATITGASAATFSAQSAINTALAGPLPCNVKITTIIGDAVVAHLTMKKLDNTTEVVDVSITSAAAVNALFAVGDSDDLYVDCTAITVTGGTSGAFQVVTITPRTPAP